MTWEQEDRRSAWIDGELPTEAVEAFEDSLDPAARERLEREREFDALVMERLEGTERCPDELWERVQGDLWEAGAVAERARFGRGRLMVMALPVAAAVLLLFALLVPPPTSSTPTFLQIAEANQPAVSSLSEVDPERQVVEQFIRQQGIGLSLSPVPAEEAESSRPLTLRGARRMIYNGEPVVHLLFTCGGHPATMVLAKRGGAAEEAILEALQSGRILMAGRLDEYIAAIIGKTDRPGCLMGMISVNGEPCEIIQAEDL